MPRFISFCVQFESNTISSGFWFNAKRVHSYSPTKIVSVHGVWNYYKFFSYSPSCGIINDVEYLKYGTLILFCFNLNCFTIFSMCHKFIVYESSESKIDQHLFWKNQSFSNYGKRNQLKISYNFYFNIKNSRFFSLELTRDFWLHIGKKQQR